MVSDFNKKGNREFFNDQLLFKTVGVLFLFFIIFMIVADFKIYQKKRELVSQISIYQKQVEDIKNSSQNLKNEIANSNSTDYLEKLGYEEFGETKPGETEYMFINSGKKTQAPIKSENFWDIKMWGAWLGGGFNWIKSKI
jgi:cell division protein FtsB